MKRISTSISAFGVAAMLAACGGGSSSQVGATNGMPFSNGQTANLNTLASQGNIAIKASEAAYTTAGGFGATQQNLTLNVVDVNNINVSFGNNAVSMSRVGGTGPFTGVLGGTNVSANLTTDSSIFFGQFTQNRSATINDSETFFVTGFESDPANLTATASYSGDADLFARNRVGGVADATATQILNGTLAMTVDFGTSNITSGAMSGLDDEGNTLTLTISPAGFSGNSFSTTATASGASDLTFGAITVQGAFFGDNGEQVGGTMHGNVTGGMPSGSATSAAGYFEGS